MYSHNKIDAIWHIEDIPNRVHLFGDNDSYKYRLSSRIMGWRENNIRGTYANNPSEDSYTNHCLFLSSKDNSDRICVDRGSWMGNRKDELILINMFSSKHEDISTQYINILKKKIVYVNTFLVIFRNASMSNNIKNILSIFDDMYGNKFWEHVLLLPTSSDPLDCYTQSQMIIEAIMNEFFVDISQSMVCLDPLKNFTDNNENEVFEIGSYKIRDFIFNKRKFNFSDTVDVIDVKLMKALRVQTFLENYLFN